MKASTNLAARPFRNERLPWLIAGALALAAAAVTVAHARFLGQIVSGDEARIVRQVREDEARIVELDAALAAEPPMRIDNAEAVRLRGFKELVDRRVFPWRRLLTELEDALPGDVRLMSITPADFRGARVMVVSLSGEARSKEAAFQFAETLGTSRSFANAVLQSISENGASTRFDLDVEFTPASSAVPSPAAAPTPTPASTPAALPANSPATRAGGPR